VKRVLVQRAISLYLERFASHGTLESLVYPGITEVLADLHGHSRLFLVTSKDTAVADQMFDTAEAYGFGASEKSWAKALGSRRKEAVITTKFGVGYPAKPNYRDSTRYGVKRSLLHSWRYARPGPICARVARRGSRDRGMDSALLARAQGFNRPY
jgi:hypothetical protein